jgi:outer membrane protein assembly factor BamB
VALLPADLTILRSFDLKTVVNLKANPLPPPQVTLTDGAQAEVFARISDIPTETADAAARARGGRNARAAAPAPAAAAPASPAKAAVPPRTREWPSFRGPSSSGIGDGLHPPTVWNVEKGTNIKWKTPIPGFAHSSPVVWGDRVYVTTAVNLKDSKLVFQHGRVGDDEGGGASAYTKDDVPHSWRVYALDKATGKILWERVAKEGVPQTARHVMASQANSTPATDGQHIVAFFGSEGLYCYNPEGKLLWKRDLGPMSSGRYLDASYEWNTASSPILYKNFVILQVDLVENSYIAAFDIKTGKDVWRTPRDEQPSWPTPLLYEGAPRNEIVTAAPKFARAYDPDTGKELWRLGKHSALSTPTPVAGNGLIFITSGGGTTVQPVYAIRPGGNGDITLKDGEDTNDFVAWSQHRGGAYIPTPLFYGDLLYLCSNNGIVAAYEATTGKRVYQQRLAQGGGSTYSASPVAADGHVYFSSEDGDVTVVKAGPKFELVSVNPMGQVIMATPAMAPGLLVFRMQHAVVAVAEQASGSGADGRK